MFGLFRKKSHKPLPFEGYMDCHTHILWGVDDGARTQEESQNIVNGLRGLGFKGAWCTPHIMASTPDNTPSRLKEKFEEALSSLNLDNFDLHLAAEYMLDEQFLKKIDSEPPLTYDGKHLLIELSQVALPLNWQDMIFQIQLRGYTPVLAHPERYCNLLPQEDFQALHEDAVEFQLNLSSLSGQRGKNVQKAAERLLKADTYTWLGSDSHRIINIESLQRHASYLRKSIQKIQPSSVPPNNIVSKY